MTGRTSALLLLFCLLLPGPVRASPPPPEPTGRPDAVLPTDASGWLALETGREGATVSAGIRPLPGLLLGLRQSPDGEAGTDITWQVLPAGHTTPSLLAGVRGLGGDDTDRAGFLATGHGIGPLDLTLGAAWTDSAVRPYGTLRWAPATGDLALSAEAGRVGRLRRPRLAAQWQALPWLTLGAGMEAGSGPFLTLRLTATDATLPRPPARAARLAVTAPGRAVMDVPEEAETAAVAGHAARIAGADATGRVRVDLTAGGLPGARLDLPAADLERALQGRGSVDEIARRARLGAAEGPPPRPPLLRPRLDLLLEQGPLPTDQGWGRRLSADMGALLRPLPGLRLEGSARLTLTASHGDMPEDGNAPDRGRADAAAFAARRLSPSRLMASWALAPAPGWSVLAEAGLLEEMYGGAGGEVMLRPPLARWRLGAELHQVWKREPEALRFLPRGGVTTGFVTTGYDLPGTNAEVALRAGRYLDGGWGAALALERRLGSGASLSGEVGLAGGVTVALGLTLPLGAVAEPVEGRAALSLHPLARRAGQRLDRRGGLAALTDPAGAGRLTRGWRHLLDGVS
ncbi:YjbH domain-containing protein [Rhodospirillum centenum]|uniref:Lipoprotein, putative n=1 Tax=Rhodospirillum centenum (strain ATCC 51521 / SW) TaxID=414684 RepID=B6IND8_RHOCS|nr:YjbH domain-containing protein [Rhodospirillum centenum]ACI99035.1 lipoprotein, putative [Rhodospirillum centenum SW]